MVASVLFVLIAADHNPQGEFFDTVTGAPDWLYLGQCLAALFPWCLLPGGVLYVLLRAFTTKTG